MRGRFPFHGFGAALRRRAGVQLAPLRLRFLAALINTAIALAALGLTLGAWVLVAGRVLDRRSPRRGRPRSEAGDARALAARLQATRTQLVFRLVGLGVTLVATGHRSPGFRGLGLRRVDARSGREVTRRQELVSNATRDAWRIMTNRLFAAANVQDSLDRQKMHSEMEAARRQHGDYREALQGAMTRIYTTNKVDPRASCLRVLLRFLLAMSIELPVWSSLKQSLPDRLAGTIIVVERKSRPCRRRR
jgi:hypothetical protein